jgi:hypothetical protein
MKTETVAVDETSGIVSPVRGLTLKPNKCSVFRNVWARVLTYPVLHFYYVRIL